MGRRPKQTCLQRRHTDGQWAHEKMLNIAKHQRNANQNHNEVPVKMATIKKSTNNKYWRGGGEKRTLVHCWWDCKLVQPQWKTLLHDPAIPLLGIYPEKNENTTLKRYMHPSVHCSTIYNSQDMEKTQVPINR